MRRLSITLFSLCLASALTAQVTGSNQSVRLRADNIDEVVSAMTLEEKVHLVIGCGMSMEVMPSFQEQRDVLTTFPDWVSLPPILPTDRTGWRWLPSGNSTAVLIMLRNSLPAPRWQLLSIRMQPIRWDVLWVWK